MTEPLLRIEDLVVEYPVAGGAFRALNSVSLSVDKGTCLAVVGESGCGKSTLAKSIVRLVRPTSGRLCIDGVDIAALPERKLRPYRSRIQMVFQDPYGSLDPHLSAVDIVAEPLRQRGVRSRTDRETRAAALIDRVGLPTTALRRKPAEFSGGQRQRIGIARALASEPELLVCDEATSALDVSVQAQVLDLLREISDTIVVMKAGNIVESGRTAEVLANPTQPYTAALRAAALDPTTMIGIKPRGVVSRLSSTSDSTLASQGAA